MNRLRIKRFLILLWRKWRNKHGPNWNWRLGTATMPQLWKQANCVNWDWF